MRRLRLSQDEMAACPRDCGYSPSSHSRHGTCRFGGRIRSRLPGARREHSQSYVTDDATTQAAVKTARNRQDQ